MGDIDYNPIDAFFKVLIALYSIYKFSNVVNTFDFICHANFAVD